MNSQLPNEARLIEAPLIEAPLIEGRAIEAERRRFDVIIGHSAVLIEARSTVGPITFGTTSVEGSIEVSMHDGGIDLGGAGPSARLQVDLNTLSSGNALYDAELLQRIDARRYPKTSVELSSVERVGRSERFQVEGDLTFHGVTRHTSGSVGAEIDHDGLLRVVGEHVFDIRDFGVVAPNVLMLRIYPDVRIELQLEARPAV
jgi:polyisoprenoid-binding protein YceI